MSSLTLYLCFTGCKAAEQHLAVVVVLNSSPTDGAKLDLLRDLQLLKGQLLGIVVDPDQVIGGERPSNCGLRAEQGLRSFLFLTY